MKLIEISPYELDLGPICRTIGREWMLICAENGMTPNAMTAGWGFIGEMWGAPAAVCFIRPQRHTFSMVDGGERFSLCFFGDRHREELSFFGSHSGKDTDKAKACHMEYLTLPGGTPYLSGAKCILQCRKLYSSDIEPGGFSPFSKERILDKYYQSSDFHRMFIAKIEHCYLNEIT